MLMVFFCFFSGLLILIFWIDFFGSTWKKTSRCVTERWLQKRGLCEALPQQIPSGREGLSGSRAMTTNFLTQDLYQQSNRLRQTNQIASEILLTFSDSHWMAAELWLCGGFWSPSILIRWGFLFLFARHKIRDGLLDRLDSSTSLRICGLVSSFPELLGTICLMVPCRLLTEWWNSTQKLLVFWLENNVRACACAQSCRMLWMGWNPPFWNQNRAERGAMFFFSVFIVHLWYCSILECLLHSYYRHWQVLAPAWARSVLKQWNALSASLGEVFLSHVNHSMTAILAAVRFISPICNTFWVLYPKRCELQRFLVGIRRWVRCQNYWPPQPVNVDPKHHWNILHNVVYFMFIYCVIIHFLDMLYLLINCFSCHFFTITTLHLFKTPASPSFKKRCVPHYAALLGRPVARVGCCWGVQFFLDPVVVRRPVISRMRSEGSRLTLGVWGWGCVRQKLRLGPQLSATVRNRLRVRRKALHSGECTWSGTEFSDLWRRSSIGLCRRSVSVSDLCRRSYIGVCAGGVCLSDLWRPTRVSSKNALQKCQESVSSKNVLQEYRARVSSKSVLQKCQDRVSSQTVLQECQVRVSSKSVKKACQLRVSYKSVLEECPL